MTSRARPIVIDDRDGRIHYLGQGWFKDPGTQDGQGNFGPTYLNTQSGTGSNDSLVFSFTGSSIKVVGTISLAQTPIVNGTGNGTTWDPKWECFVDGNSIGSAQPFPYVENNWELCQSPSLSDGQHTLTVNVTTMGRTFWLDQLQYTPSPRSSSNGTTVELITISDPAVVYGPGWTILDPGTANFTTRFGSQLKFNFTGTSLSWFAFIPTELSHNPADAIYTIDGGPSVPFVLKGLPQSATTTVYNQQFLNISGLSTGNHSLVVTHLGNGSTTPLVLSYMYLTNTVTVIPPPGIVSHNSGLSSAELGGIIGGIVGGMCMIAILFLVLHRRISPWKARPRAESPLTVTQISPFMPYVTRTNHLQSDILPATMAMSPLSLKGHQSQPTSSAGPYPSADVPNLGTTWSDLPGGTASHSQNASLSTSIPSKGNQHGTREVTRDERMLERSEVAVRHHQDSGIRLRSDPIDIPPVYTPE